MSVVKEAHVAAVSKSHLLRSPYGPVRRVTCDYQEGVLTLKGKLSSFFHKQVAQETVIRLEGVNAVDNQIEVTSAEVTAKSK